MLSTHLSHSPVQSINSDTSDVWIDGQQFKVTRLPRSPFEVTGENDLPTALKKLVRRVSKLNDKEAKQAVERALKREKQQALKIKLGPGVHLSPNVKSEHADELHVTEAAVMKELSRLRSLECHLY